MVCFRCGNPEFDGTLCDKCKAEIEAHNRSLTSFDEPKKQTQSWLDALMNLILIVMSFISV